MLPASLSFENKARIEICALESRLVCIPDIDSKSVRGKGRLASCTQRVMAESSDDSGPIGARYAFKAATALQLDSDDDGDKGSPIPEWISQHATPPSQKVRAIAESSDSDAIVDLVSQPPPRQEEQEATKSQHSRDNGTAEPAARKPEPQRKGSLRRACPASPSHPHRPPSLLL